MAINTTDAKKIKLSDNLKTCFFMYKQAKDAESKAKADIKKFEKPLKEFLNKKLDDKKLELSQVYICNDVVFRYKNNGDNIQLNSELLEKFLNKHGKKIEDFKEYKGLKAPSLEVDILLD